MTFDIELDVTSPAAEPSAEHLRGARARIRSAISARWRKSLDPATRATLGELAVDVDAARVTLRWDPPTQGPDPHAHPVALAAAMEAAAIAKALAPLGRRPRNLRTGLEALAHAPSSCGLCAAAANDPLRWLDLPASVTDALRALSPGALRAAPFETRATLAALLGSSDPAVAFAAAHALARLIGSARAAERATLSGLVVTAWAHADPRVVRAALRSARAFRTSAPALVLDAWVAVVARHRDDGDVLTAAAALARAAARAGAFAAALPVWLRSRSERGRRAACACLREVLPAAEDPWTTHHAAAFDALVGAAEEGVASAYVPLLLRHLDRLSARAAAALYAWLDAADGELVEVSAALFARQPTHPALNAACVRLLLKPSPDLIAHGFATRDLSALDDDAYGAAVDLLLDAAARAEGTPVGDELRACLDQVLCDHLDAPRAATGRLLAAMIAPGTSAARLDATAARLLGWWTRGLRDEKLRVVRAFVEGGHTDALTRAFRTLTRRSAHDEGAARAARIGLGLSWSMQRAGAWAEGGEVARVAASIAPIETRADLLYNAACGFAMTHDAEGAARALAAAIALDPRQADDARADADFAAVRHHPALVALLDAAPPA